MVSGLDLRQQLHQLYGHNHLLVRILVGSILILVPQLHVTWQLVHVDLPNAVIDIGNTQLVHPEVLQRTLEAGIIYNITRSAAPAATPTLSLTSPAVGQVIGDDGKNYDYASLPGGVTAVAKICYVSGSNGLALALADEGQMNWSTAISTCAAHTPAFTGGTWKLASKDEWDNMINVAGFATLRDGFTSVGGSNLESDLYWSSSERNASLARYYSFFNGSWSITNKDGGNFVRSCLAF